MGLYTLIKYAPKDNPNRIIIKASDTYNRLKKWSLYYLFIWIALMVICFYFNLKLIIISSCFGLIQLTKNK